MIISFSITNFRSIKDKITLNLEAGSKKEHEKNLVVVNDKLSVLKTVGIYGANASGKSNIIDALYFFRSLAIYSNEVRREDRILPEIYNPFRLDKESASGPIEFELDFIGQDKLRYIYTVIFTREQILKETLYFYPEGHKAKLFTRENPTDDDKALSSGTKLDGKSKSISCLKNQTFLSCACNSNGVSEKLLTVYRFIKAILDDRKMSFSSKMLESKSAQRILSILLSSADFGIDHIEFNENDIDISKVHMIDGMPEDYKKNIIEELKWQPLFFHGKNKTPFEIADESTGTRRLYEFAPTLIAALTNGLVVVIDEIESHLHPHIIKLIINLFNDPEINRKNAQLIYTTHSLTLLDESNTRRDQVVFTEKNTDGITNIYALDEFAIRKDTDFVKYYMDGRFGALPKINFQKFKKIFLEQEKENIFHQGNIK